MSQSDLCALRIERQTASGVVCGLPFLLGVTEPEGTKCVTAVCQISEGREDPSQPVFSNVTHQQQAKSIKRTPSDQRGDKDAFDRLDEIPSYFTAATQSGDANPLRTQPPPRSAQRGIKKGLGSIWIINRCHH